jgi:hypothetical protein
VARLEVHPTAVLGQMVKTTPSGVVTEEAAEQEVTLLTEEQAVLAEPLVVEELVAEEAMRLVALVVLVQVAKSGYGLIR